MCPKGALRLVVHDSQPEPSPRLLLVPAYHPNGVAHEPRSGDL